MVSHELMGPWEHCILQCIPTCHGILGIPDPEMCTCGILRTLGCGTLGTLDPEMFTCHGTLGTQDPEMYTGHSRTNRPKIYNIKTLIFHNNLKLGL